MVSPRWSIWFRGDVNNTPAPLYAKINGTKVSYNNGAAGTAFPLWKQWNINLASLGISLKSVKTLTIGVGDGKSAGSGKIFIDDIRLYATAPQAVVPADPGTNGLVLLYAMEGNIQDTSGKGNNGTASGNPAYGNGPNGYGKALKFDGLDDYVTLPIGTLLEHLEQYHRGHLGQLLRHGRRLAAGLGLRHRSARHCEQLHVPDASPGYHRAHDLRHHDPDGSGETLRRPANPAHRLASHGRRDRRHGDDRHGLPGWRSSWPPVRWPSCRRIWA